MFRSRRQEVDLFKVLRLQNAPTTFTLAYTLIPTVRGVSFPEPFHPQQPPRHPKSTLRQAISLPKTRTYSICKHDSKGLEKPSVAGYVVLQSPWHRDTPRILSQRHHPLYHHTLPQLLDLLHSPSNAQLTVSSDIACFLLSS